MEVIREILLAEQRVRAHLRETPLEPSPALSRQSGAEVYLKLENFQHTGSFKARGAMNKILALEPSSGSRGVVAASTGNHGAAVAFAAGKQGIRSLIFVPEDAAPGKIDAMRMRGAEVRAWGSDCVHAEVHAREHAAEQGMTYISPYNDPQVVGGQGTAAVEIARQIDRVNSVFVALGGGGLIAGIAGYLKGLDPRVRVIGCSPANSCVMAESLRAGRILEMESRPTLSDGTAGGVEQGSITFELCRGLVDECALVTEEEIADALRSFIGAHHMLIEGAAAVAIAAFLKSPPSLRDGRSLIVICGGNIGLNTLRSIL